MNLQYHYSVVGVTTCYGLDSPGLNPSGVGGLDSPRPSRPAVGSIQSPIQWVPGLSLG